MQNSSSKVLKDVWSVSQLFLKFWFEAQMFRFVSKITRVTRARNSLFHTVFLNFISSTRSITISESVHRSVMHLTQMKICCTRPLLVIRYIFTVWSPIIILLEGYVLCTYRVLNGILNASKRIPQVPANVWTLLFHRSRYQVAFM